MTDQPADDGHVQQAHAEQLRDQLAQAHRTIGGLRNESRALRHQRDRAVAERDTCELELQRLRPLPAQLAAAQAELANLHEGEEPYDDERTVPTPGQWITLWNGATPAERLDIAAYRLELMDQVNRCTSEMHAARVGELHEYRQAWSALQARAEHAEADRNAAIERAELLQTQVWDCRQRILDIDAHATPYGVRTDDPEGNPRAYLVTVGSLHRALGTVGHTAPKCDAEARIAAVRALHAKDDSNSLGPWCGTCLAAWPCPTVAALDGPADQLAAALPLEALDADALTRLIRAAQYRRAEIDPDRCPADCAEGHTYTAPCSGAYPDSGSDRGAAEVSRSLGGMVDRMLGGNVGAAFTDGQAEAVQELAVDRYRFARASNAVSRAISGAGHWVPLSVREAAARAALDAADGEATP